MVDRGEPDLKSFHRELMLVVLVCVVRKVSENDVTSFFRPSMSVLFHSMILCWVGRCLFIDMSESMLWTNISL